MFLKATTKTLSKLFKNPKTIQNLEKLIFFYLKLIALPLEQSSRNMKINNNNNSNNKIKMKIFGLSFKF
jgi:hypothetical protein